MAFGLLGGLVAASIACGSNDDNVFVDGPIVAPEPVPEGGTGTFPSYRADCEGGVQCQQVDCPPGQTTTLTGTVTAPNGTLPLYNAIVYVPLAPLEPLADGVTCDRCGGVSGKALVSALTDADGRFELRDVPVGENIPLVIQIGKWRRRVAIKVAQQCAPNVADPALTRLPRNHDEGDIPRIAVTTGWCDQLACLLPKLGLDPAEFSSSDGMGRLHLYRGAAHSISSKLTPAPAPGGTHDASELYDDLARMRRYDMVMLSCECGEHTETKSDDARRNMYDYASSGGRIFASHFHYTWAQDGWDQANPLSTAAEWSGKQSNPEPTSAAAWAPFTIDQSFAKGEAFAKWLVSPKVGASTKLGEMPINQPRENVGGVKPGGQRWVYSPKQNGSLDTDGNEATKYLSINTPVGPAPEQQCGKFVYADMHLYAGDEQFLEPGPDLPDDQFPQSCGTELTAEEKALAFLFFDLASCIQDDRKPPVR